MCAKAAPPGRQSSSLEPCMESSVLDAAMSKEVDRSAASARLNVRCVRFRPTAHIYRADPGNKPRSLSVGIHWGVPADSWPGGEDADREVTAPWQVVGGRCGEGLAGSGQVERESASGGYPRRRSVRRGHQGRE